MDSKPEPQQIKRKRGRPRKSETRDANSNNLPVPAPAQETEKRKRGRLPGVPYTLNSDKLTKLREIANSYNETPDESFAHSLKAGVPLKYLLEVSGINHATYDEWSRIAKDPELRKKNPEIAELFDLSNQIDLNNMRWHLENIRQLASGEKPRGWWVASQWFLERRYSEYFGKPEPQQTVVNLDLKTVVNEAERAANEYRARLIESEPEQTAELTD